MKEINFKDYPIGFLTNIQSTFESIRKQVELNNDKVRITFDDDFCLVMEDLDFKSKFKYTIKNPELKDNKVFYEISYSPKNSLVLAEHHIVLDGYPKIVDNFKNWLNLISSYKNINIHPHDKVLQFYQNKFFESFKFLDDDNSDEPLNHKQQVEITKFLNLVIKELENNEEQNENIISEIRYLNSSISQLTQKQIKTSLSWFFAKIMYLGIDSINRITKVGVDAGIGFLLIEGVKKILGS